MLIIKYAVCCVSGKGNKNNFILFRNYLEETICETLA